MREIPNWPDPSAHIVRQRPDTATVYFCPVQLQKTAQRFRTGFGGLVSYAVKANPGDEVLANLVAAGITAFDVASPREMYAVRAVCPHAVLHYNNPVRSPDEVKTAISLDVGSYSVDCMAELDKLQDVPPGTEVSVRLALQVSGAAYDFGEKFGAGPEQAATILRAVADSGLTPAITFHPGTQCADPQAWETYITASAQVAAAAGVRLSRLNVGGGFAAHRTGAAPDLERIFDRIKCQAAHVFGTDAPHLVCEPGRAMVADSATLAARIKAIRPDGSIFLNDGIYGALAEARDIGCPDRLTVLAPEGTRREGTGKSRIVFGPTCDSLDRLPDPVHLPHDLREGDYLLIGGMGAYAHSLSSRFNGYGPGDPVTVATL